MPTNKQRMMDEGPEMAVVQVLPAGGRDNQQGPSFACSARGDEPAIVVEGPQCA
jgi:hypothetical protein